MKRLILLVILPLLFTACTYKAEVKGGYENEEEMFVGVSEWPLDPIKLHIWKTEDIAFKCDGVFTKGYSSGGVIENGGFNFKCIDGKTINGNWYSPSGQNNLVGKGKDENGNTFHLIAGTELGKFPNLENNLRSKLKNYSKEANPIDKSEPNVNGSTKVPEQPDRYSYSTGTGFFITTNGYLITNQHVVSESVDVFVILENKDREDAKIIATDPMNDLALLKIERKTTPLPLVSSSNLKKGQQVLTVGYPLISLQGNEQKASFGNINALTGIRNDLRMMQIDVPIQPGNSGGPLMNYKGEVVGVATASLNSLYTLKETGSLPQNINYAMKSGYIFPILTQYIGDEWRNVKSSFKEEKKQTILVDKVDESIAMVVSKKPLD